MFKKITYGRREGEQLFIVVKYALFGICLYERTIHDYLLQRHPIAATL